MATANQLYDISVRHQVFIERLKSGEVAKFAPFLKRIDKAIRERLSGDDITDFTRARLEKLLEAVDGLLLGIFTAYTDQLNLDLIDLAQYEASFEASTLSQVGPATFEAVVPAVAQIRAAVLTNPLSVLGADGGKLLKPFIQGWASTERTRVVNAIRQGFFEGQTNSEIIKAIRGTKALQYKDGILATTDRNASAIVRTAVQHVATQARMETLKENSDVVQAVEWVSTLDSRTTPTCKSLDGKRFKIDEGPRPPIHINCLPGDTLVASSCGIAGASKRWFDGEVVVFRSASGRELTCTPNHPILTDSGWIAAKSLNLGDKVVSHGGGQWAGLGDSDHKDMPATIHEVAEAFFGNESVVSMPVPVAAPDFHGDGVGSDIAVIGADRVLSSRLHAALTEHGDKVSLVSGGSPTSALHGAGAFGSLSFADNTPCDGSMCSACESSPLLRGEGCHPGELLLTSSSDVDSSSLEVPLDHIGGSSVPFRDSRYADSGLVEADGFHDRDIDSLRSRLTHLGVGIPEAPIGDASADAVLAAKLLNGHAGLVFLDEIVDIRNERFSGHVYNLETVEGWYVAAGIVTHNCRSTIVPVTRFSGLFSDGATRAAKGASGGEQVEASLTYYDWLQKQPAAFQDEALGKARAQLFRNGGLSAERFSALQLDRNFKPLTLDQMRALEPLAFQRAGI